MITIGLIYNDMKSNICILEWHPPSLYEMDAFSRSLLCVKCRCQLDAVQLR